MLKDLFYNLRYMQFVLSLTFLYIPKVIIKNIVVNKNKFVYWVKIKILTMKFFIILIFFYNINYFFVNITP